MVECSGAAERAPRPQHRRAGGHRTSRRDLAGGGNLQRPAAQPARDGHHGRRSKVAVDAILHRESGGQLLVELEIAYGQRPFSYPNTYHAVRGSVAELNSAATLTELYDIAARTVRELTGFDRVMVYRFDADWQRRGRRRGKARRPRRRSSACTTRRPTSRPRPARLQQQLDAPHRGRRLHARRRSCRPANPRTGRPLDLSHARLRSVSPIHLEYLRNMGVGASMSVSLCATGGCGA